MANVRNMTPLMLGMLVGFAGADRRKFDSIRDAITLEDEQAAIAREHGVDKGVLRRWVIEFRSLCKRACEAFEFQPCELVQADVNEEERASGA